MLINPAPIYSSFDCIYPGPHSNHEGKIDNRVWFSIPIDIDYTSITYLVFPFDGAEEEVQELIIRAD